MPPPADPSATDMHHLFHPAQAEQYLGAVAETARRLTEHLTAVSRPSTGLPARQASRTVGEVDLDEPVDGLGPALQELSRVWLDDAVWFHDPGYAAHLNCPVVIPAVAAEMLISAVNPSLDTYDQSTGATFVERHLVDWVADRIGFPRDGGHGPDGIFTSGGTQSNLQALLLARQQAATAGVPLARMRILAGSDAHFSVQKAARLLGLGEEAVLEVPVDTRRRLDPDSLAEHLRALELTGLTPVAVVATAGTTDFGAIDPLPAVADACAEHGAWLHVDAAYGGGLLVSRRRRHWLAGIERADSATVDFHKTWFQPISSSALLVRDGATLGHATWHADYLNPRDAEHPNQVDKSIQTTRRFDALKLWLTLRAMGPDTVGDYLDAVCDVAEAAYDDLTAAADLEAAAAPQLSTLVFRFRPAGLTEAELDTVNSRIRAALFRDGAALVASTRVRGRVHLKLTLLNPLTTAEHVRDILARVREAGEAETVRLSGGPALAGSGVAR